MGLYLNVIISKRIKVHRECNTLHKNAKLNANEYLIIRNTKPISEKRKSIIQQNSSPYETSGQEHRKSVHFDARKQTFL